MEQSQISRVNHKANLIHVMSDVFAYVFTIYKFRLVRLLYFQMIDLSFEGPGQSITVIDRTLLCNLCDFGGSQTSTSG